MSLQRLIIVNASKFGREIYTWAQQAIHAGAPWAVKGFLDDRPDILRGFKYDVPILGSVENHEPAPDELFLLAIGEPQVKKRYYQVLERKGARFATLIHPTALIGYNVAIGEGSVIGPLTQLSCDIILGKQVCFGTNSNTAHDTRIGDFTQVSGSCEINGNAELGESVFLGSHATILPNVRVGDGAFIGAGSVVLKNVKPGVKMFGNPAVQIGVA